MVVKRGAMPTEDREKMRGGDGTVHFTHMVDCKNEKNVRLLSEIRLEPGCSIGYHQHDNETEYFFIVSGTGVANDDGTEKEIGPGDAIITGDGASHGIKNTGKTPLVFHAVIVTH